jgi:hypothetical protein
MFAPIILGDLGIFRTIAEFGRSEVLSYRDNLFIQGHNECSRCNTEVTQGQDPLALGVDFIPNMLKEFFPTQFREQICPKRIPFTQLTISLYCINL